jgi:hypothetical protein
MHLTPTPAVEQAEAIVAGWRGGLAPAEGWDSPAGPLFPSGEHAETDITMSRMWLQTCGTNCSSASCLANTNIVVNCC